MQSFGVGMLSRRPFILSSTAAGPLSTQAAAWLAELKNLREKNDISEAEYQDKRKMIIGSL